MLFEGSIESVTTYTLMNDAIHPTAGPTANGQAYRAYLEAAAAVLERLSIDTYYSAVLPSPADEALAEIVSAFTAWPESARKSFISHLPPDKRALFGIFGHRAATLAVRNDDPEWLRLGLIGNVIANSPIPPKRNVDAALAVFYHCAQKLGLPTLELFDDTAEYATEDMALALKAFGRRDNVNIKQFGWREIKTPEGVRYRFEW